MEFSLCAPCMFFKCTAMHVAPYLIPLKFNLESLTLQHVLTFTYTVNRVHKTHSNDLCWNRVFRLTQYGYVWIRIEHMFCGSNVHSIQRYPGFLCPDSHKKKPVRLGFFVFGYSRLVFSVNYRNHSPSHLLE